MSDEAGLPIDSLTVGRLYPMIHAKVFVERTNKVLKNTDFSIYCGFYNNDELISIIHQEKSMPTDSGLVFDLEIPNITPLNTQYELRFFIWGGKENLVPYAESTAFLATTTETVSQENDMKKIKARITNDLNLFSKSANPQPFLDKLNPNGKFNDIDYTSKAQTNWEPSTALSNVSIMLKAYYTPENRWYSNPSLKASIDSVLADWAKNQYKSTNWWYNDIDTPNKLSIILLYPLSSEEYLPALKTLTLLGMPDVNESLAHKSSDTGGNLTDKLLTAIRISAATGDSNSMKNTVSYLLDNELSVFSQAGGGEGIMPDSSFHQHGSLLYNGSYGNVFCSGVNTLLKYLSDTEFMVSDRAINTYADFILDGHSWMFHGNGSDFSIYGRAISRKNGVGGSVKSNSLNAVNSLISNPNLTRRRELLALKENRLGASDLGFSGAKHFWTSDLTIFHRPDFYVSVRGSSKRNKNTEYMNKENSKAYYIADGATTIMRTGSEYQNIFAVWDWSNIPGTTTTYLPFEDIPSPGAEYGATEFVGGVSNGKYAVSAMDYSHNGVKAKRA
ncbi:MAG: polysaccharide lyase family 8 super-sandwich domain-containing protein, partial [Oscillospiraceae bacterium]